MYTILECHYDSCCMELEVKHLISVLVQREMEFSESRIT